MNMLELIAEVELIKSESDTLAQKLAASSDDLIHKGELLLELVRGSRSGELAGEIIYNSVQALKDSIQSLALLDSACESCLEMMRS